MTYAEFLQQEEYRTFDYESPLPLFASGAQAAAHGMAGVENPPIADAGIEQERSTDQ